MPRSRPSVVPHGDSHLFQPSRLQPVRVRSRRLAADAHFEPHRHAWAQLAYCASGIVQVSTAGTGSARGEVTYIVPPSRAVWIAPGTLHSVHVLEDAQLRTLYLDPSVVPTDWHGGRVILVSPLLRELIPALDATGLSRARESLLVALVLDELRRSEIQALGVPSPEPTADKRLRALCEAVLRDPSERATLAQWAARVGASERTLARLFREQLGTSYQQWRQQAVLAHALPLLARGLPVSEVAAASGYASESAFTAMFKTAMGQPPSQLRGRVG
jgi:AraC-like DNA-binding protein